jgi:small subunit ribosomal protein S29
MGHTDYEPIRGLNPAQYTQKTYTANLLQKIAQANRPILHALKVSQNHNLPLKNVQDLTLLHLCEIGAKEPNVAWPLFEALWAELTIKNTPEMIEKFGKRPPVLFSADNISYLFSPSGYEILNPETDRLVPIHSFDFLLPKHIVDHITGAKILPNGGLVLGATSKTHFIKCQPLSVGIAMGQARRDEPERPAPVHEFWNPLFKIDRRVLDEVANLDVMKLQGIPKEHAQAVIEYWAKSGMVDDRVEQSYIGQKWTLSGGGVIGELEKAVISMSLTAGAR